MQSNNFSDKLELKLNTSKIFVVPEVTAMACSHVCPLYNECDSNNESFSDLSKITEKTEQIEESSITTLFKKNALLTAILIVAIKIDDSSLKKGLFLLKLILYLKTFLSFILFKKN